MHSIDFHAHHAPLGAYASFTCGRSGRGGGWAVAASKPPDDDLVIGWADDAGRVRALPFFTGATEGAEDYGAGAEGADGGERMRLADGLERDYRAGTDTWRHGRFAFTVHTPVWDLPDPARDGELLQDAITPVLCAELAYDNRDGDRPVRLFLAQTPKERPAPVPGDPAAVMWGGRCAIAAARESGATGFVHWSVEDFLRQGRGTRLGSTCGVVLEIPPGVAGRLPVVFAAWCDGAVTSGVEGRYWYRRRHASLAAVIDAGRRRFAECAGRARAMDDELDAAVDDPHRRFLIAHAQRSYWGNTQLLDCAGIPRWVVYEGEYAMMNTFDLAVDQVFYEVRRNPWVVANLLDQFLERYSFHDTLARPPDAAADRAERATFCLDPGKLYAMVPEPVERGLPGGISFCHDMGVGGHFAPPGESSYELDRLVGCFSHMTCEQLLNWICCATTYYLATGDRGWLDRRAAVLEACQRSLINRDDPVPSWRNGIVSLDSDRCDGGWEITTYDSLDHSLGQARANLYVVVKSWAAHLGLERCFADLGELHAQFDSFDSANRIAAAVADRFDEELGHIPAVFEGGNRSAIIPAIEALVFPLVWKLDGALEPQGPYAAMLAALRRHLEAILVPGVCLFDDGGWKLSSTSDNSWLSKIFLCQHVAEKVFGIAPTAGSHAAHAAWQQLGSADWAMSDQCHAGVAKASRYYPRCVSNDLWLA